VVTWSIAAALTVPVLFWLGYLCVRDRVKPEPLALVLAAFGLGTLAAIGTPHLYALLAPLGTGEDVMIWSETAPGHLFAYCLGVIGPVEELAKLVPFVLVCGRFRALDEEIDGIVYASAVGLGYATVENIHLLTQLEGIEIQARALASPLVHSVFASIWGWAYARARVRRRPALAVTALAWAIAALLHGIYDFLALSPALAASSALVILAIWIWRIRLVRRLHVRALAARAALTR
jgi:RsiW-degrading membrane proteinase PrsW (M82 family)